jgi:HAD superfamily hydrolase (TIGR01509 family)
MEEVVRTWSEKCPTALVSNTNEIHHLTSTAAVPALGLLPTHYVSYELKALKPDEAFYRAILADLALPAGEVVFIDDLEENVEGARRAGMIGVRFTSVDDLKRDLDQLQNSA